MAVEEKKGQVVCSNFGSKKFGSAASSAVQFQSEFLSFLGEAATGTSKTFYQNMILTLWNRDREWYTRVFFISITDFAWASQCLIFQPFEPQKMLIQCLEFASSNNTFELKIGKSVQFWQYVSFVESIWIHKILKMPNFSQILYQKGLFDAKVWLGQPQQMLRKCLNFPDFEA